MGPLRLSEGFLFYVPSQPFSGRIGTCHGHRRREGAGGTVLEKKVSDGESADWAFPVKACRFGGGRGRDYYLGPLVVLIVVTLGLGSEVLGGGGGELTIDGSGPSRNRLSRPD